ncbi:MAG: hypothetical protein AB1806_13840 [Acidobacteriota bacterium]
MRRFCSALLVLLLGVPASLGAWGAEGHRLILDRAIDLLPREMRPAFERERAMLIERAVDPDLWRVAGFEEEAPRHFLDFDAYGVYPFAELPADYGAALQKFGRETVTKNGLLPWHAAEIYGRLVRAFEAQKSGAGYGLSNALFLAAVLSHYVADAHQPFHAVVNYDGQLTNQHGVHGRFESDLVSRYRGQLVFSPAPARPLAAPRDVLLDTLRESARLVDGVLAADLEAVGTRTEYDDGYYAEFFARTKPLVERRMSEAMTAVAGLIAGAWEQAGRPDLNARTPRPVQKVRSRIAR